MLNIYQFLVSPETKQQLYFNKTTSSLISDEGSFEIRDGIPILLPNKDNLKYIEHYQKDAEYFDYFEARFPETHSEEERIYQYVLSRIPPKAKFIADIGCGNGWLARRLLNLDRIIVSIDVSFRNVSRVLKLYPDENHFGIVADGYFLPFRDNTFDCVVASEVIEHLEEPQKFVGELLRIVAPNGKVILTTPYKEKIRYTLCIHCNKPTPWNAHLHSFDEYKFKNILQDIGLIDKWSYRKFGNSLVQYLRLYRFLKIVPFKLWKIMDSFLNLFFKPKHLLIEIIKREK